MKLAVIPSPFTQGKFVIILPPRTGTSNLILCESDFESGLPVEWVDLDIANLLVGLISELAWASTNCFTKKPAPIVSTPSQN
jgi:hypothetical protein